MKTTLIDGASLRPDDSQIILALQARTGLHADGYAMTISIRNCAGELYRALETVGLEEFLGAVETLRELGLTDELEGLLDVQERCDAIFS